MAHRRILGRVVGAGQAWTGDEVCGVRLLFRGRLVSISARRLNPPRPSMRDPAPAEAGRGGSGVSEEASKNSGSILESWTQPMQRRGFLGRGAALGGTL